jgi:hypothetical protein
LHEIAFDENAKSDGRATVNELGMGVLSWLVIGRRGAGFIIELLA